jgi:hypothetical protein
MSFNDLANELAELDTLSSTSWFFHGCLDASIEGIIQKGLEIKETEPCLTPNPASALWKYANPASNSRNIYSGKAWHEINCLIEENKISPGKTETETWQLARRYWRNDASSGGTFMFFLDPTTYQVLPAGKVLLESNVVHGSISKWIYSHCSVTQGESQGSITLPGNTMVGYLKPGKNWNDLFVQLHPRFSGFIPPLEKVAEQVQNILHTSSTYHPLQKVQSNDQIALALVENAANAFLLQEVRKLLLAIAFIHGHEIVKDDHTPPEKWPVPAPGQTMGRLAAFMEVEYANPQLQSQKEYWLARLKTYLREPENEN